MNMTSGDLREIAGLTESQLRSWRERGVLAKGRGKGNHMFFTFPELLAATYAGKLIAFGYGNAADAVIEFLAGFSEDELLAEFKKGNRFLLPIPGALKLRPLPDDLVGSHFDLEGIYKCIVLAMERAAKDQKAKRSKRRRGRRRGLASE